MSDPKRPLKVFLCHAHADRDAVRGLYSRLTQDGVDAWLDKEKLLPGQDWELEIRKAVREADVVVFCLSKQFNQAGFRQKEVRWALETAMEELEEDIFIIPARLEDCDVPEKLQRYHWVDLFDDDGYERLMRSLRLRDNQLERARIEKEETVKRRLPYFETLTPQNNMAQQGGNIAKKVDVETPIGEASVSRKFPELVEQSLKKQAAELARPNPRRKWSVITILEVIASIATICACLIALYSVLPLKDWLTATPIATNTSISSVSTIAITNTPLVMVSTPTHTPIAPDLKMYIANGEGNGGIAVVNTANNSIITTIFTGATSRGIAINNDKTIAYSADLSTNQISVIDLLTNSVITTIPVGQAPGIPVLNHTGNRLYVTNFNSSTVSVIDTKTNKVIDTILNVPSPWGIDISPDDSYIAVTLYWSDAVSIYDVKSLQLISTVKVGSHPQGTIYLPDNSKLYIANPASSSISVIDTKTNLVIQTIQSGSNNGNNPTQLALNADATKLYVTNIDSDTVSEIDVVSGTVVRVINVGDAPSDVAVAFPYLYVTNSVDNSISVVDVNTGETITRINGFIHPNAIKP